MLVNAINYGWDESTQTFKRKNLPPEWKNLFKTAGIKKRDLDNPEMAKLIMDTCRKEMSSEQLNVMPPLPGITTPRAAEGTVIIPPNLSRRPRRSTRRNRNISNLSTIYEDTAGKKKRRKSKRRKSKRRKSKKAKKSKRRR